MMMMIFFFFLQIGWSPTACIMDEVSIITIIIIGVEILTVGIPLFHLLGCFVVASRTLILPYWLLQIYLYVWMNSACGCCCCCCWRRISGIHSDNERYNLVFATKKSGLIIMVLPLAKFLSQKKRMKKMCQSVNFAIITFFFKSRIESFLF